MLALASVVGSLVPQWPNSPERVVRYQLDHPLAGALYGRAGLFDVYGSWWFVLITALLFVSLVACLLPRTRALVRDAAAAPVQAREIDAFRLYEERVVPADPAQRDRRLAPRAAPADVPRGPRRRRPAGARRREGRAPRGREPALPLGVPADRRRRRSTARARGSPGRAVVVEGKTWIDAQANYDGAAAHRPVLRRRLHRGRPASARASRTRTGGAGSRWTSSRTWTCWTRRATWRDRADIRVNEPASIDGVEFFQYGFGWAPVVEIRQDGELIASRAHRVRPGHGARGRPAARDAVARHPEAAVARSADGSDVRAVAGQPRVAAAADDRRARGHDAGVPADPVLRRVPGRPDRPVADGRSTRA